MVEASFAPAARLAGVALALGGACGALTSCTTQPASVAPAASTPSVAKAAAFEPAQPLDADGYARTRRDRYNRIYADPASYNTEPNAFLLECLDRIEAQHARDKEPATPAAEPRRAAVDLGMGDGRNTIPLAQRGYRASGFDMSDVGVNLARQRAAGRGLEIDAQVAFLRDFDFSRERWDVVVLMYFPLSTDDIRRIIVDSVRPGGYVILERAGGDLANDTLRPFRDWHILYYEQHWGDRDWAGDRGHPAPGPVTRLLVRKPWPAQ